MHEIFIETTDLKFFQDLKNANISGIGIWDDMAKAKDSSNTKAIILSASISIFTSVAGGLLANWIYERNENQPESKTIINHQYITNQYNIEKMTTIINNECKEPKKD